MSTLSTRVVEDRTDTVPNKLSFVLFKISYCGSSLDRCVWLLYGGLIHHINCSTMYSENFGRVKIFQEINEKTRSSVYRLIFDEGHIRNPNKNCKILNININKSFIPG